MPRSIPGPRQPPPSSSSPPSLHQQPPPSRRGRKETPPSSSSPPPPPTATSSSSPPSLHQQPPPSRRRRRKETPPSSSSLPPPPTATSVSPPPSLHQQPPPSRRRRRKEEMVRELVCCYSSTDIQALMQDRSDEHLDVNLASLESLRVAKESYELLRQMVDGSWICTNMDLLSLLASVALELQKVEADLFPNLLVQGAKLEGDVLKALLLLKNSTVAIIKLGKAIKKKYKQLDKSFDDGISGQVCILGQILKDIADRLISTDNIVLLQERVRRMVQPISSLLATPVRFPHSE